MLPDNLDALNACFRDTPDTVINIRNHGTVGIKHFVSIQMHVMTGRSCIIVTQVYV